MTELNLTKEEIFQIEARVAYDKKTFGSVGCPIVFMVFRSKSLQTCSTFCEVIFPKFVQKRKSVRDCPCKWYNPQYLKTRFWKVITP